MYKRHVKLRMMLNILELSNSTPVLITLTSCQRHNAINVRMKVKFLKSYDLIKLFTFVEPATLTPVLITVTCCRCDSVKIKVISQGLWSHRFETFMVVAPYFEKNKHKYAFMIFLDILLGRYKTGHAENLSAWCFLKSTKWNLNTLPNNRHWTVCAHTHFDNIR